MNVIVVEQLSRHFGSFKAVDNVNFHVEEGEIFGYLGANGAGKSTTIRMLCGLLSPTSGDATVVGHRISKSPEGVKRSIGYMSQRFSLYMDLPVEENLAFFGGAYGLSGAVIRERQAELLKLVDLKPYLKLTTSALPGGIRQRLALCCALLHRPKIVFLDEPTAGVDPVVRREFWTLIRALASQGVTIFVTTHYMDEAENCARIGLMADGVLRALDTPAALKRDWVPGSILSLEGEGVAEAVQALKGRPGILAVEAFGSAWHVRFDTAHFPEERLRQQLQGFQIRPAVATLEDVFLAVVSRSPRPT